MNENAAQGERMTPADRIRRKVRASVAASEERRREVERIQRSRISRLVGMARRTSAKARAVLASNADADNAPTA